MSQPGRSLRRSIYSRRRALRSPHPPRWKPSSRYRRLQLSLFRSRPTCWGRKFLCRKQFLPLQRPAKRPRQTLLKYGGLAAGTTTKAVNARHAAAPSPPQQQELLRLIFLRQRSWVPLRNRRSSPLPPIWVPPRNRRSSPLPPIWVPPRNKRSSRLPPIPLLRTGGINRPADPGASGDTNARRKPANRLALIGRIGAGTI